MEYHTITPSLKKLSYIEFIDLLELNYNCLKDDYTLQEKLLHIHTTNNFVKNISDLILKLLCKNSNDLSIREKKCYNYNSYVINISSSWDHDMAVKKFREHVIKPILDYIYALIYEYHENKLKKPIPDDPMHKYMTEHFRSMGNIFNLEFELINDILSEKILHELSPYFYYTHIVSYEIEESKYMEFEELINLQKKNMNLTFYR